MFKDEHNNHSGSWLRLHRHITGCFEGAKELLTWINFDFLLCLDVKLNKCKRVHGYAILLDLLFIGYLLKFFA